MTGLDSISRPSSRYLQKNVQEKVEQVELLSSMLHESVSEFVDAVNEEYIDQPQEKRKKMAATKVLEMFEEECSSAQDAAATCGDLVTVRNVESVIAHIRDENQMSFDLYKKALKRYSKREVQYEAVSPIARKFLSPRSQSAEDAWAEADQKSHPEKNFCLILVAVFVVLILWKSVNMTIEGIFELGELPPPGIRRMKFVADAFKDKFEENIEDVQDAIDDAKDSYEEAVEMAADRLHIGDMVKENSINAREL